MSGQHSAPSFQPATMAPELLRRTLRGMARAAPRSPAAIPRCDLVARVTGLPSGDAIQLCRWAGLDPYDRVIRQ